jgi:TRAP-type C4-dicarboxylate transport system permease small subunit
VAIEADEHTGRPAGSGPLTRLTEKLAMAGGLLVLGAAALVCVSVGLRWLAATSVPGDFELVQIAVALAAFAFLPYAQIRRGNITVTTFTAGLPRRVQAGIDAFWDVVWAGFAALIAWRLAVGALEMIANHTTSMVSGIPLGWPVAATAAMACLLAIAGLATALRLLRVPS